MKSLRTLTLLLLLAGLFGTAWIHPVAAQTDLLTLRAKPAHDGYVKNGEWLTVWVEVENKGKDLDGQISVQITGSSGKTTYAAPVALPSGARKRVPVYILPNNYSHELEVQLTAQDKLLAKDKITVRPQANLTYLVGLLAPERGGLALLNGIALPGQERPKIIVDLSLDDLPDRVEGLRSFNLLVLNDLDTARLTPAQASALADWVYQGGQLVIGGGVGAASTLAGLPAELIPVSLNGQGELRAEDLGELVKFANGSAMSVPGAFIYSKVTPAAQARTLAKNGAAPLLVESRYGSGLVDFVALSLSTAPFSSWPDTIRFWNRLLASLGEYPEGLPPDVSATQMRAMNMLGNIANIPALDLPSIQGLTLILGLYILLVGPVNYFVLRRMRRMQLAWVTIPILTLLFSVGAFGIGYLMRGTDVILNQISLIEPNGRGGATLNNYLGLFSPSQQAYSLEVKTPGLLGLMNGGDFNPWGGSGVQTGGNLTFIQGARPQIRGLAVDQWSFQPFMEEERWDQFGKISADLRLEGEMIVGTLRNETSTPITNSFLIAGPYFIPLGDLPAGGEKQVVLSLANFVTQNFGQPVSFRLYEDQLQNGVPDRMIDLKRSIVSIVLDNQYFMGKFSSAVLPTQNSANTFTDLSVTFLGWVDQAPPEVSVEGYQVKKQVLGLVSQKLSFRLGSSDEITIPIGMIPGQMIQEPTSGGNCGGMGYTAVYIESGAAEFLFQVPEIGNYTPQELRLSLGMDGPGSEMPEVALYNWKDSAWTILKAPKIGVNRFEQPQDYVSAPGTIRVRVSATTSFKGFCTYLDLGLKAKKSVEGGPNAGR